MSFFDAVILGILQGLTEFLPVSSSGHLVLAQIVLGVKQSGVTFEVLVHFGSLLAVIIYFQKKIIRLFKSLFDKNLKYERQQITFLAIGTVPAVIAFLLFKDFFEQAFSNPILTSVMLIITGLILLSTKFFETGGGKTTFISALIIGIAQAAAIIPGLSRSGTTISVGMIAKVKPSEAAEFSFLLAIPAIAGAVIFKINDLLSMDSSLIIQYLLGVIITFITSLLAIYAVLTLIKKGKFVYFAYYCFAVGIVGLYLFL
ncbi:MAG: undecaprenyl-diphosphate phosphatase [Candidatus Zixiibacteriota bacterium]